jgi:hypothetical protein
MCLDSWEAHDKHGLATIIDILQLHGRVRGLETSAGTCHNVESISKLQIVCIFAPSLTLQKSSKRGIWDAECRFTNH